MPKKKNTTTIKTVAFPDGTYFELPKPVELSNKFIPDPKAIDPVAFVGVLAETLRLECEALTGETIPVIVANDNTVN